MILSTEFNCHEQHRYDHMSFLFFALWIHAESSKINNDNLIRHVFNDTLSLNCGKDFHNVSKNYHVTSAQKHFKSSSRRTWTKYHHHAALFFTICWSLNIMLIYQIRPWYFKDSCLVPNKYIYYIYIYKHI